MRGFSFRVAGKAFKDAFRGFSEDKITKLSASLAYYTVFSLAPLLLVMLGVFGFFFGREALQGQVDNQLQGFIGIDAAKQIQEMLQNAAISGKGAVATTIGVITLLIGATTIFAEIQDSINGIWGLKPKPKVGFMKTLQTRLLSFGLIASIGFLLVVSLIATTVAAALSERIAELLPGVGTYLIYIINFIVTLSVITPLFVIIFKVLPDAKIHWKDVMPGALVTGLLFMIGKSLISLYVTKSDIGSTFGAAGSLVILLVWIYYSSIILYFGAEFTKWYVFDGGKRVVPNKYAQWVNENAMGKERHPVAQPRKEERRRRTEPSAPMPPVARDSAKKSNKGPGMGTVLVGLALYYINRKV